MRDDWRAAISVGRKGKNLGNKNAERSSLVRFLSKVDTSGDCHVWMGCRNPLGYGKFSIGYKTLRASRASYEMFVGHIADGNDICHRCDNPQCVRPSHLFQGTAQENIQDSCRKGRFYAKRKVLPAEIAQRIPALRNNGLSVTQIAEKFGVTRSRIWYALYKISTKEQTQ